MCKGTKLIGESHLILLFFNKKRDCSSFSATISYFYVYIYQFVFLLNGLMYNFDVS